MCGITGYWSAAPPRDTGPAAVEAMIGALRHRGPDGGGVWQDTKAGIALGHRRLAIVDLSPEGSQPMASASGRYVIAFNGEIYNFQDLRRELQASGAKFRGTSDTEVVLASFEAWGLQRALARFVGMFAFALWDRSDAALTLARDRLGEKPLYYGWTGDSLLFGSELKALRRHFCWRGEIDRDALALSMRFGYVPAPYSIYQGIRKLLPGTFLRLTRPVLLSRGIGSPVAYWAASEIAEAGMTSPLPDSPTEAAAQLESRLRETIRHQMIADVPLGAFLSGGVDSSTIVALMQTLSSAPVRTFSIGFHESDFDEAQSARAVARHLGTEHTELYVTPAQMLDVIPRLPEIYDEPFSDSSQVPTFLISQLARHYVTVALSGDAGDELFAGYNRYRWGSMLWRKTNWLPAGVRHAVSRLITRISPNRWDQTLAFAGPLLPGSLRFRQAGEKLHKLAAALQETTPGGLYRSLTSYWHAPLALVLGAKSIPTVAESDHWPTAEDLSQRMMFLDLVSYLPDDILVKVDRASMATSLESRIPFLDHRIVEFAWRLPLSLKIRDGQTKWLLRQVLYRHVPRELIERPKAGFAVPVGTWLRGPLRTWAEDLLAPRRIHSEGYLDAGQVQARWKQHLSGERSWQDSLWAVLMFQAWLENQRAPTSAVL